MRYLLREEGGDFKQNRGRKTVVRPQAGLYHRLTGRGPDASRNRLGRADGMRMATALAMAAIVLGLGAAAGGAAESRAAAPAAAAGGFQHFITRSGDKLMDGPNEFRFVGANMPGLILPYDYTQRLKDRMVLPTAWEQEDGFRTLAQMNLRVVRWWCLPMRTPKNPVQPYHYVLGLGEFNEEAFKTIDRALVLANKYGIRVDLSITADAGSYFGGIATYAAWRDKPAGAFWTDPQVKEDFKATLRYLVNRKNTISGVAYKDEKAILCWEFGNEMRTGPDAWQAEMAAYLKGLDPNHLILDAYDKRKPMPIDPNVDILNRHYYGGDWVKEVRADRAAARGQRPLVIGEFGLTADAPQVRAFLDEVDGCGVAGAMIWSLYFHREAGGFWWHQIFTHPAIGAYHWPGFSSGDEHHERDILSVLRNAAFTIQGLAVPPRPAPEPAPVLLPVGDVPHLSWRGSTGAAGYDIERAASPQGPWTVVGKDVSDADAAYRPLWSDETARAGDTVYYRVTGHNATGRTAASNVVGPVKVREVCLVDELKDLTRPAAKSGGLKIVNDHNAFYVEHLFRAKGDAGEFLVYKTPGLLSRLKVAAWFADKPADLTFQTSADGQTFADVKAERSERLVKSPVPNLKGASRTLVEYEAAAPAGTTHVKILWTGPAEVDRVEVYNVGGR